MAIDKIKRKNGFVYRARVIPENGGRRRSKCFDRKVDAEMWEASVKIQGASANELKPRQIRFSELCEKVLEYGRDELEVSTHLKYEAIIKNHLIPELGNYWADIITKKQVMEFRTKVHELNISGTTKNHIFSTLKTVFRKGVNWDLVDRNPTDGIKSPRKNMPKTDYWSNEEALRFLSQMNGHPRLDLYLIVLNTAMRAGEVFGLCWDCIDLENRLITVKRTFDQKVSLLKDTTKTHKTRSIGINDDLFNILVRLKQNRTSDFVINKDTVKCNDTSHIARAFRKDCEQIGVKPIRFHDLRHTYASQFVRKSGNMYALSKIMGHTTTAMTERYSHFAPEQAVEAASVVSFAPQRLDENVIPFRSAK